MCYCPASFASPPERIISLAPGITEILFAAGLGDRVVGVTSFCDYPEEAKKKPKIGGMSNPSLEAVVRLRPDIVVMTTDGNPAEFQRRLDRLGIRTHVFRSLTIDELPGGIRDMGLALGEEERFTALASGIERTIAEYASRHTRGGGKILFIISPEPLIVAGPGTAIDDAIRMLGWTNIAGNAQSRYPKFSIETIFRQSPDVIVIGRMRENMEALSAGLLKKIDHVRAVKNNRVMYLGDGLYRLGPRVTEGIAELAEHLGSEQKIRRTGTD